MSIKNEWDWSEKSPVIRLSLDAIGHKEVGLRQALIDGVSDSAKQLGIHLEKTEPAKCFQELIVICFLKCQSRIRMGFFFRALSAES